MKTADEFSEFNICECNKEKILTVLEDVLMGKMEPKDAVKALNHEDLKTNNFSQEWLSKFTRAVETVLDNSFPKVHEDEKIQACDYLNDTNLMIDKMMSLVELLKDTILLKDLLVVYNHRIFTMLDLLLDRSSSLKCVNSMLFWVLEKYLRYVSNYSQPI